MRRMNYADALRCIAQDLERRGLRTFDVQLAQDEYLANCGYQEPPAPTPVTIHYTVKDLEELDQVGEGKRDEPSPAKELINQIQIFFLRRLLTEKDERIAEFQTNMNNSKDSIDKNQLIEHIEQETQTKYDQEIIHYPVIM